MFVIKLIILYFAIHYVWCQPVVSLIDDDPAQDKLLSPRLKASHETDFNGDRYARHVFGGIGVFGGSGFGSPVYAAQPVSVVSAVPVLSTVPVVSTLSSYPVYGGYGGYGGGYGSGFGGFGAGFGIAKFRAKGFGVGGGFFG